MCLRTDLESVGVRSHPYNRPSAKNQTQKNSEKRKEKSRDAARCRRGKESEIFTELANALPLPSQSIAQLDKASVMRLTIAYLKTRGLCQAGLSKKCVSSASNKLDMEMRSLFLEALDGFLIVLSPEGDIIYTSENITTFLGLPQVDVMGQCLYDYTHPCDHEEARALVSDKGTQELRHAFLRLKCTITSKGRSVNLKSATYKVVRVSGELVRGEEEETWLVALGTPVPHPSNIEFPLDKQTFVSKHSLDMKFTYVDDNVSEFCGYKGDELMGRSLYEMHHALDTDLIKDAYRTLRSKGQVETGRYRFLARDGGYVWVVTQATLIHGPKDHKPQCVVCLNYVVSGVESPDEVLSELQLQCSNSKPSKLALDTAVAVEPTLRNTATPTVPQPKKHVQPKVNQTVNDSAAVVPSSPVSRPAPVPPVATPASRPVPQQETPLATTWRLFSRRTEEMNKGYLTFSEDDPLSTELKDEPDDLTHLAPSGGDDCVPLDVPTFGADDMFIQNLKQSPVADTDVALFTCPPAIYENSFQQGRIPKRDEYEVTDRGKTCNRLSGGKITVKNNSCSSPSSACSSPGSVCGLRTPEPPKLLLSEASLYQLAPSQKLPKGRVENSRPVNTTESLFSPLEELTPKLELKLEDDMDLGDFEMRAPYIPLTNELLMPNQEDLMWGAPDPFTSLTSLPGAKRNMKFPSFMHDEDSSLAQLLRDRDPPIAGSGPEKNLTGNPSSPYRSQYQQNKFLDGGGSFVDPNKVLPGHFGGKDGVDDGPGNESPEDDPPQMMIHESVEPPPPLLPINQQSLQSSKRRHSPSSSPLLAHKKLCSLLQDQQLQQQRTQHQQGLDGLHHQVPQLQKQLHSGVRELTTPYAPTMQQLLISKEPITVRGGRPGGGGGGGGGGMSTPLTLHKGKDSVLRNLLNLSGNGEDSSGGGDSKILTTPVRLSQERVAAMLMSDGGSVNASSLLSGHKFRILTGGQGSLMQADQHSLKLLAGNVSERRGSTGGGGGGTCSHGGGGGAGIGGKGGGGYTPGEGPTKRGRLQDPLLLMDPDLAIPNFFELSQLDYEVNAPANNSSLLQGADLLMALDQSL